MLLLYQPGDQIHAAQRLTLIAAARVIEAHTPGVVVRIDGAYLVVAFTPAKEARVVATVSCAEVYPT